MAQTVTRQQFYRLITYPLKGGDGGLELAQC
jgi:hypothetical protein